MKKRFIVKKEQLNEYVENKKNDKILYDIVFDLYRNKKYLKENVSINKANNDVIKKYKEKNLISEKLNGTLIKYQIIDIKSEIL